MNTKEILSLPAKEGLLFCHTFGKTLRGSDVHAFAVRRCAALMVCPVNNLFLYVHLSDAMGINLRTGYLFRVANNKGQIMPDAFPGSAVGNRLKKHLTTLRISDGETMHSFRSGCSITLSLLGASSVAHHVGWKSLATARYYTQTRHVMHTSKTAALLSDSAAPATSTLLSQASRVGSLFRNRNNLHNFSVTFSQL